MTKRKPARSIEDRFWARVDITSGTCWVWLGAKAGRYGRFSLGRRRVGEYAHRWSYEHHNGPIPSGLFVCHRCDNPACVRPDHLFVGSARVNQHDMYAKGRGRKACGERAGRAKLTEDQVREIRSRRPAETFPALAREFGISKRQAQGIVARESWKHV